MTTSDKIKHSEMKTLAITFVSALLIVGAALLYDNMKGVETTEGEIMVGKTVVTYDATGRAVNELTLTTNGKEWKETMMKQMSYTGGTVETATYVKNEGEWVATARMTYENVEGTLALTKVERMGADGQWSTQAEIDLADLSDDEGMMNDMVFDASGNLIMNATYVYDEQGRRGIQKEEYDYEQDRLKRRVSYEWGEEGDWQKQLVSNLMAR